MSTPFKVIIAIISAFVGLVFYEGYKDTSVDSTSFASNGQPQGAISTSPENHVASLSNEVHYLTPDEFVSSWNSDQAFGARIIEPFTLNSRYIYAESKMVDLSFINLPAQDGESQIIYFAGDSSAASEDNKSGKIYNGKNFKFCISTVRLNGGRLDDVHYRNELTLDFHFYVTILYRGTLDKSDRSSPMYQEFGKYIYTPATNYHPDIKSNLAYTTDYKGWAWSMNDFGLFCATPLDGH